MKKSELKRLIKEVLQEASNIDSQIYKYVKSTVDTLKHTSYMKTKIDTKMFGEHQPAIKFSIKYAPGQFKKAENIVGWFVFDEEGVYISVDKSKYNKDIKRILKWPDKFELKFDEFEKYTKYFVQNASKYGYLQES